MTDTLQEFARRRIDEDRSVNVHLVSHTPKKTSRIAEKVAEQIKSQEGSVLRWSGEIPDLDSCAPGSVILMSVDEEYAPYNGWRKAKRAAQTGKACPFHTVVQATEITHSIERLCNVRVFAETGEVFKLLHEPYDDRVIQKPLDTIEVPEDG